MKFHILPKLVAIPLFAWCFVPPLCAQVLQQTFSDNDAHFQISTPMRWSFSPRGTDPGSLRLTIRFESPLHQFTPNVTVLVLPLQGKKPKLETLVEQELKTLPSSLKLLDRKEIRHHGTMGYEISLQDPASSVTILQRLFLYNRHSYLITCTAKEASYPRILKDFIEILNSFQFI
jgi:hypothetical protein